MRILPVLRAERAAGGCRKGAVRVLAAWIGHLRGAGAPVADPRADEVVALAAGPLPEAVPRVLEDLDPALAADDELVGGRRSTKSSSAHDGRRVTPGEVIVGLDVGTTGVKAVAFGVGSSWRRWRSASTRCCSRARAAGPGPRGDRRRDGRGAGRVRRGRGRADCWRSR